jgi:hypothetical protein
MPIPDNWKDFVKEYSFKDIREIYTNGSWLIPTFRVEQMMEHFAKPEWISVKDRLPEKHGWYLTAHKKTYPTDSGMKICFFCYGYFTTDKEVTHWRPLPEYPESEEKLE